MLDFDITRDGVPPKDAATVLLIRDGASGLEIFCVERNRKSRFLGGAIVFPGGKVDAADHDARWASLATAPRAASSAGFGEGDALRAYAVAACRESLEEAALLPVANGALGDDDVRALRTQANAPGASFAELVAARGLTVDLAALYPFARWVTPTAESRRYDTRFFLGVAPRGQTGAHDEHETMASFWAGPSDVLARFVAGEIQLAPPTHRSLEILATMSDVAAALAWTGAACLEPICPRLVPHEDASGTTMALVLPGDPEHGVRELRSPGHARYVMRGERWFPESAPPPKAT